MLQSKGERMCRVWFGPWPWLLLYGAEECEAILGSNRILKKPFQYKFLSGWIGQGLLIRFLTFYVASRSTTVFLRDSDLRTILNTLIFQKKLLYCR